LWWPATYPSTKSPVAGFEEAIQAAGASVRYLPQYSPDLNPIELVFHSLKTLLRKAAERSIEGLERCVGSFVRALNPTQCVGIAGTPAMNHYDRDVL
jgi:transposase